MPVADERSGTVLGSNGKMKPAFYDMGIEFVGLKDSDRVRIERIVDHFLKSQQKSKL